jgi:hypothetical protein
MTSQPRPEPSIQPIQIYVSVSGIGISQRICGMRLTCEVSSAQQWKDIRLLALRTEGWVVLFGRKALTVGLWWNWAPSSSC